MNIEGPCAIDVETSGEKRSDTADPRRATFDLAAVAPHGYVTRTIPRITNHDATIVIHNQPYDAVVLGDSEAEWQDTKMLAHLGGESDTSLKGLTVKYLNRLPMTFETATESDNLAPYCMADAVNTWDLYPILLGNLKAETQQLYFQLEQPLSRLWARMTMNGSFYIDRPALEKYGSALMADTLTLEDEMQSMLPKGKWTWRCGNCGLPKWKLYKGQRCDAGGTHKWKGNEWFDPDFPTNVRSPPQLLDALTQLGLDVVDSTDMEVLQGLRGQHPVIDLLLEYRGKQKELSTYVEPWLLTPEGQRIGSVWRPVGTGTGRISSAYPNLQNVPHALERFFRPAPGHVLLEFDNGQLEVRVAAVVSGDPVLLQACRSGDVHGSLQAAFGLSDRRRAKVWTFGTMYLGGPPAILREAAKAGDTKMQWSDAEIAQQEVRRVMPYYFRWTDTVSSQRVIEGLFGRMHYIPLSDRQAVNWPIQGGAGTITKFQMLALDRAGFTVVRQVHDSVTVEVPESEAENAKVEVPRIMETAVDIGVPIVVEPK